MPEINRLFMRAALEIHEHLEHTPCTPVELSLPAERWRQSEALLQLSQRASQAGLLHASRRSRRQLCSSLCHLRQELLEAESRIGDSLTVSNPTSAKEIYLDLLALQREFDEVKVDRPNKTLTVTTEPLELEDIYLGPFEICLDWQHPTQRVPLNYSVIAQDPHPASSDPDVTHPHVQHESVCEGDGSAAVNSALQQGRLLDFFTIVANLLRTYNASSPYVSLSSWNGVECADCGILASDDDSCRCDECETAICIPCNRECTDCHRAMCSECVSSCTGCDESHCDSCLKICSACNDDYCNSCLEEEMCRGCHDDNEHEGATDAIKHHAVTSVTL